MPTRNEFGVKLDKNGYAPSLFLHDSFRCYRCGCFGDTARHEIYGGSRRSASKALRPVGQCLPRLPQSYPRKRHPAIPLPQAGPAVG